MHACIYLYALSTHPCVLISFQTWAEMPGENLALASRNDQQTLHSLVTVCQGTTHAVSLPKFRTWLHASHYEHYHEHLKMVMRESEMLKCLICRPSMVHDLFRPSHHLVFDHFQYAKMEGEGLVYFIMWMTSVSTLVDRGGEGSPSIEWPWGLYLVPNTWV